MTESATTPPRITVDWDDASVDIATSEGHLYRVEVDGESLRLWAPNGETLVSIPRSSNVMVARALTRPEQKALGL